MDVEYGMEVREVGILSIEERWNYKKKERKENCLKYHPKSQKL
ncbi:Uncharacterized protein BM_BM1117 [Brugia malayi]|uniref:Bm1117 n=1 Tax=Brugia malayi TaxID=6279 RepID=A0A0J9Y6Z0_BRUMA|nr:Uncharacterized protein BM_BM1117 [Brugia malayi]CDQ03303.1 Bm1117 [Brugia malayi]VIO93233.1 Uncharacterized protein BM_BM1117 [Brugia malayi]